MKQKEINKILRKYKKVFDMLEEYDRTKKLLFERKRVDITLSNETLKKLKDLSKKQASQFPE